MTSKKFYADLTLWLGTLIMSFPLGATLFNMLSIVPSWTNNLPDSMVAFDKTGIDISAFWMTPVLNLGPLLLIVSLILSWRTARKKWLLAYLIIFILMTAVTFVYFLPKLGIMGIFPSDAVQTNDMSLLTSTTNAWVIADKIRFFIVLIPSFLLLLKTISIPSISSKNS